MAAATCSARSSAALCDLVEECHLLRADLLPRSLAVASQAFALKPHARRPTTATASLDVSRLDGPGLAVLY
ncbi:hypothetical protein E2562_001263 [Oryza meyeriana var. granulata]|uniref:Uncharacterized protein n=1 Tax=Oryza meyeriana var. granulata TaxID=110450 RepID=A0A6G1DC93_9ORYZ|nr:hypothetical protein E2562_001263 [Oryza meyeriana var. granulata]